MFAAIMMARNEEHIVGYSIGHLLYAIGVDSLIFIDNGSDDGTASIVKRAASIDNRIVYIRDNSPFEMAPRLINDAAREAKRAGHEWLLPTDADEFLWAKDLDIRKLNQRHVGAWQIEVVNFLQNTKVLNDRSDAIMSMNFSAKVCGTKDSAMDDVNREKFTYIESDYPPKLIIRYSRNLHINLGHHDADGLLGLPVSLPDYRVLHAPLRSRQSIEKRLRYAQETNADSSPEESWHIKRYLKIAASEKMIDREWIANSCSWGRVGLPSRRAFAKRDLRLHRVAKAQQRFVDLISR